MQRVEEDIMGFDPREFIKVMRETGDKPGKFDLHDLGGAANRFAEEKVREVFEKLVMSRLETKEDLMAFMAIVPDWLYSFLASGLAGALEFENNRMSPTVKTLHRFALEALVGVGKGATDALKARQLQRVYLTKLASLPADPSTMTSAPGGATRGGPIMAATTTPPASGTSTPASTAVPTATVTATVSAPAPATSTSLRRDKDLLDRLLERISDTPGRGVILSLVRKDAQTKDDQRAYRLYRRILRQVHDTNQGIDNHMIRGLNRLDEPEAVLEVLWESVKENRTPQETYDELVPLVVNCSNAENDWLIRVMDTLGDMGRWIRNCSPKWVMIPLVIFLFLLLIFIIFQFLAFGQNMAHLFSLATKGNDVYEIITAAKKAAFGLPFWATLAGLVLYWILPRFGMDQEKARICFGGPAGFTLSILSFAGLACMCIVPSPRHAVLGGAAFTSLAALILWTSNHIEKWKVYTYLKSRSGQLLGISLFLVGGVLLIIDRFISAYNPSKWGLFSGFLFLGIAAIIVSILGIKSAEKGKIPPKWALVSGGCGVVAIALSLVIVSTSPTVESYAADIGGAALVTPIRLPAELVKVPPPLYSKGAKFSAAPQPSTGLTQEERCRFPTNHPEHVGCRE